MERESFENDAIAKILNDNFVSIKVDREERCVLHCIDANWPVASLWPNSVQTCDDSLHETPYLPPLCIL